MRILAVIAIVLLPVAQAASPARAPQARVDAAIEQLWSRFDMPAAMGHVEFVSRFWRLAGNPGYDATIDHVRDRLTTPAERLFVPAGAAAAGVATVAIDSYPSGGHGWDHSVGTLAIVRDGRPDEPVLSREKERLALCINSFSTPPDGVVARIIDAGNGGRDADYASLDVKGAVVLGDAGVTQLWQRAVVARGAIGVVSTQLPDYLNADPPGVARPTPRDQWDILQWGSVPYDEARKGFGFKATPHAAATLRRVIRDTAGSGGAKARVTIASTFSEKPARTLIAEIPGRTLPDERVVMAVHVQEPGANDNASGVGALTELARAMAAGIRDGRIPPPARTITFLWLDEISGSRRWLQDHAEAAKLVKYMFSMDMVGEDVAKTGGSFLVERWPDPGAVWDRPWDPHSEWGRGNVRADQLKGDLLNDVHLDICRRVAARSAWVVKTNPYEGGSDHTEFGRSGIPSLLDWHFTDRYYHTNMDTADKTSAAEMRNVAVAAGATAWGLASAAGEADALAASEVVATAGRARLALEKREGDRLVAAAPDRAAAQAQQDQIVAAWKKWYGEAIRSASRLLTGTASPAFARRLDELIATIQP
jgi:hypothetical protein